MDGAFWEKIRKEKAAAGSLFFLRPGHSAPHAAVFGFPPPDADKGCLAQG